MSFKATIKFDNEELNCLNVCLDHFIEEQTDAFLFDFYPSFPFKKKDFHQEQDLINQKCIPNS